MTDALNEHIIVPKFDARAVYKVNKLPTRCKLLFDGLEMKVGDTFTQADVRKARLSVKHFACEGEKGFEDAFYFTCPQADGTLLNAAVDRTRSACLPPANSPENGIFKFPITVFVQPFPKKLRNSYVTLPEDATMAITKSDLFYSSDNHWIEWYLNRDDLPMYPATQTLIFWDRFEKDRSYTRGASGSVNVPPGSEANLFQWEHGNLPAQNDPNNAILVGANSNNYIGVVSPDQVEYFKTSAILSSDARDDDMIGMVIAYRTQGGVPRTLGVARCGRGVADASWFVYTTNGTNTITKIMDGSGSAPTLNGGKQNWGDLGPTRVQVIRKGDQIEVQCSQFGSLDLDPATTMTFTVPSEFTGPQQFGLATISQQNAMWQDMLFAGLPNPTPPETPDPTADPMWERFPAIYTVLAVSDGSIAEFYLNGVRLKAGDTFTHKDLYERKLECRGLFAGGGRDVSFRFRVCTGETTCKCTTDTYKVFIREWPWPKMRHNQVTMQECQNDAFIDQKLVEFYVEEIGASTPAQISIKFDAAKTAQYQPNRLVDIVPHDFTQADINSGGVHLTHTCGDALNRQEVLWFTVCTQHNKCKSFPVYVTVTPLPVIVPPLDPHVVVTQAACTFKGNFTGDGYVSVGDCGVWATILGRVVPPPTIPGQVIYIPNASEGPKTIVAIPTDDGLEWQELPFQIAEQPPTSQCPPLETAPNTDRSQSYIELDVWGDYGDRAPFFDLYAGSYKVDSNIKVDRLKKTGQAGNQTYGYNVPTARLGNGPVKIVFTGNEADTATKDINLTVNSITVNGQKYTMGSGLTISSSNNAGGGAGNGKGKLTALNDSCSTPAGPYQPAPYIGKGMQCFYGQDGTLWVSDKNGVWGPVTATQPGPVPDWTPLIKTGPYLVETDTLELPPLQVPVYHKPTKTVFTEVKEEPVLSDNPYTRISGIDQFLWIGSNEFWVPNGTRFSLYFAANRFHTRFDIMPELGTTLISATDDRIWDRAGFGVNSILRNNRNSSADKISPFSQGTRWIRDAMGLAGFGNTDGTRARQIYPVATAWDPDKAYNPPVMPAQSLGSYLTTIPGTSSLGAFASAIRPVGMTQYGTVKVNTPDLKPKYVEQWKEQPLYIYSKSGLNENGLRYQIAAKNDDPTQVRIAAYNGVAYGTAEFPRHFDSWKLATNTNYNPPQQIKGWVTAQYMFMDWYSYNAPFEARQGGPWNGTPPSNFDYSFRVRAFDTITGESKVRTYTIHWNKTGIKPGTKKTTAIVNDTTNYWPGDPSTVTDLPSGTAVCSFTKAGEIGNCTFTGDFKPGNY